MVKYILFIVLILGSLGIVEGCVIQIPKPEVTDMTLRSVYPKVDIRANTKFTYLGEFKEDLLGDKVVVKYKVYIFGVVEDNILKEAVAMVFRTLPDGWRFIPAPRGTVYVKAGGYKWISTYRAESSQSLFGKLGQRASDDSDIRLAEAYATTELTYPGPYNTSLSVIYMLSIDRGPDFYKWGKFFRNKGDRSVLSYQQRLEWDTFLQNYKKSFAINSR